MCRFVSSGEKQTNARPRKHRTLTGIKREKSRSFCYIFVLKFLLRHWLWSNSTLIYTQTHTHTHKQSHPENVQKKWVCSFCLNISNVFSYCLHFFRCLQRHWQGKKKQNKKNENNWIPITFYFCIRKNKLMNFSNWI